MKCTPDFMSVILTFLLNQPLFCRDPQLCCWHIRASLNYSMTITSTQYSAIIYFHFSFTNTYLSSVIFPSSLSPTYFYIFLLKKWITEPRQCRCHRNILLGISEPEEMTLIHSRIQCHNFVIFKHIFCGDMLPEGNLGTHIRVQEIGKVQAQQK